MTQLPDDLGGLWRSNNAPDFSEIAAKAVELRRTEIRKAAAETLATLVVLGILAWVALEAEDVRQALIFLSVSLAAVANQAWNIFSRHKVWRSVGASPRSYWKARERSANLALNLGRLTYVGGPIALVTGLLLGRMLSGSGFTLSATSLIIVTLLASVTIVLGWRASGRRTRELRQVKQILAELVEPDDSDLATHSD